MAGFILAVTLMIGAGTANAGGTGSVVTESGQVYRQRTGGSGGNLGAAGNAGGFYNNFNNGGGGGGETP